jgi:hypothetical protein
MDDLFRVAAFAKHFRADDGVAVGADVRIPLVIEVVQKSDDAPEVRVTAEPASQRVTIAESARVFSRSQRELLGSVFKE